jgi:hypothetical protein
MKPIQPVFILQDAAENSLVKSKKQERRQTACRDGHPEWATRAVPIPHLCLRLSDQRIELTASVDQVFTPQTLSTRWKVRKLGKKRHMERQLLAQGIYGRAMPTVSATRIVQKRLPHHDLRDVNPGSSCRTSRCRSTWASKISSSKMSRISPSISLACRHRAAVALNSSFSIVKTQGALGKRTWRERRKLGKKIRRDKAPCSICLANDRA